MCSVIMCFRFAVFLGIMSLAILICAFCAYICIRTRTKGWWVSGTHCCSLLLCSEVSFLDPNFYEGKPKGSYFTGLKILEYTDLFTDVVTVGLIFDFLPVGFQALAILSILLTVISSIMFGVYSMIKKPAETYSSKATDLSFSLFLAGVEDMIQIPLNLLFLGATLEDVDATETVAVILSTVLGLLVFMSRLWSATVHLCWGNPVYPGDYRIVEEYLEKEENTK